MSNMTDHPLAMSMIYNCYH